MNVTVLGIGAIGGWIAHGTLAAAEVARAEALDPPGFAVLDERVHGAARLVVLRAEETHRLPASGDPAALPPTDLLVLALKGQDLPAALPLIRAAMAPHSRVLSAQNGVPWFFLQGLDGPLRDATLASVDPGGALAAAIPADRVIAAVIHAAAGTEAPGAIRLAKSDRLPIGSVTTTACDDVIAILRAGAIPAEPAPAIRDEIWRKLWGNSNMNPLSALCRATLSDMLDDPGVRGLAEAMMMEMDALGLRLGLAPLGPIEARMAVTRRIGAFRTSMLQDLEAGRPLELAPVLGALVEMAARLDHPAPVMRGIHGLVRLLTRG